ncbi:MAG: BamA/TamA family outer membrane protein [Nannocystaceae bacterium]
MPRRLPRSGALALLLVAACAGRAEDVRGVDSVITRIDVEGVRRFKKDELLEHLNIGETSRLLWEPKHYYIPALLPIDSKRIVDLYRAYGYYDAEVVAMTPHTKPGRVRCCGKRKGQRRLGKTRISIEVREGAPTPVRDLEIEWPEGTPKGAEGGPPDPKATPEALTRRLPVREGETFEIPKLERGAQHLRANLKDRGYAFAEVTRAAEVTPGVGVDVDYSVRPGKPVKIGEIAIEGLVGVPEQLVRNEIDYAPGKPFSPALLERIERSIYAMEAFLSVTVEPADEPRDGAVDLTVRVVEASTQSLKVGPGIRLDPVRWEERASLLYTHKNLFHNLTRLSLRLSAGYAELPSLFRPTEHGPTVRFEPKLSQKGFLEKRTTWTLAPSFELGIWQGYQFYSPQLRMGPSRFFTRFVQVDLTYNLRFVDFFNISPALNTNKSILGRDFRDPYLLSYLEPAVTIYLVDEILTPKNGAILDTVYDIAGLGGDFSFHKVQPTIRGYFTPRAWCRRRGGATGDRSCRFTLAARATAGFIFPFGAHAGAPIDMRFYLGGADTVRGWGLRRLSPRVEDDTCDPTSKKCLSVPVGGQTMVSGNLEARVRIAKKILAVAFVDAGDVQSAIRTFRPSQWNVSVGPGVRYESPVGLFRLDVGFQVRDTVLSAGERFWGVHFGLGEAF